MGVRLDRPGTLQTDYHTVLPPEEPPGRGGRARKEKPGAGAITWRHYLADAAFLVGLEAAEPLLRTLYEAVRAPVWPLALGRRSFPPSPPIWLPDGLREEPLEAALSRYPWLPERPEHYGRAWRSPDAHELEAELECLPEEEGELRQDVPVSFDWQYRAFTVRRVRRLSLPFPPPVEPSTKAEDEDVP
jgi:CRISPR system Cascade subunit CasD